MPLVLRSETNVRCSIEARRVTYNDPHTAGRFVSAIIDAGPQVKFLHEFPVSCFRIFPFMRLNDDVSPAPKGRRPAAAVLAAGAEAPYTSLSYQIPAVLIPPCIGRWKTFRARSDS